VSLLEGGYNPPELGRCVTAHVTALTEAAGN
jgi:acetoin utilization deacetylase AcuC-like enzyme